MSTFVIGDIHGACRALKQVIQRCRFNYETDRLICLGDVTDGWPEVRQSFDELLRIRNLIYIMGNHDWYLLQWFKTGDVPYTWKTLGGEETISSYQELKKDKLNQVVDNHKALLNKALYYFVDERNRAFVHGGFDWNRPIGDQLYSTGEDSIFTWDRDMVSTARQWEQKSHSIHKNGNPNSTKFANFEEVFVGHTTTMRWDTKLRPMRFANLWALDQGAGYYGKLTLMDVDTHEYWQSDQVTKLYQE